MLAFSLRTAPVVFIVVLLMCVCDDLRGESPTQTDGFASLMTTGNDLSAQWKFDDRFWRLEEGVIIGETSQDNQAPHNTFLILKDRKFGDFELVFEYQVTGFNSGIQYRSEEKGDFVVKGLQADFEAPWHDDGKTDKFSGMFFEENGRMFMAQRGEVVIVRTGKADGKKPEISVIGKIGDAAELAKAIKRDGWNSYRVVARGNTFIHVINGQVMSVAIDEDTENSKPNGIIAFQLHEGPPMRIKVRDLKIREF